MSEADINRTVDNVVSLLFGYVIIIIKPAAF